VKLKVGTRTVAGKAKSSIAKNIYISAADFHARIYLAIAQCCPNPDTWPRYGQRKTPLCSLLPVVTESVNDVRKIKGQDNISRPVLSSFCSASPL